MPLTPRPGDALPVQAVAAFKTVSEAVRFRLRQYGQSVNVFPWDAKTRPTIEGQTGDYGPQAITYRFSSGRPDVTGAGRWGSTLIVTLEVKVWVRMEADVTGSSFEWSAAAWALLWWIMDALHGKHLYASYNAGTGAPTGNAVTTAELRIQPKEWTVKEVDAQGWGYVPLEFDVPILMPTRPAQHE